MHAEYLGTHLSISLVGSLISVGRYGKWNSEGKEADEDGRINIIGPLRRVEYNHIESYSATQGLAWLIQDDAGRWLVTNVGDSSELQDSILGFYDLHTCPPRYPVLRPMGRSR